MPRVADLADWLSRLAPLTLAEEWDNVGLLVGDPAAEVSGVLTCLHVTPPVVAEALADNASLIVSHHPVLFKPTQRLVATTSEGRMLLDLARGSVAVFSPHTAFDGCASGINDLL